MKKLIDFFVKIYDPIEHYWESKSNQKLLGSAVVIGFLLTLVAIQLNIWGFLPQFISVYVSTNHFASIETAFVILLFFEVMSLVFTLPSSIASSMHKQFEIISLILLRNAFKRFTEFPDAIDWSHAEETLLHFFADAGTAWFIFFGIFMIKNIRIHRNITYDIEDQARFTNIKKMISIFLLISFVILGIQDGYLFMTHSETFKFFGTFYTILIFSDILLVLISLRYNYQYMVMFRNSAFALATVLLRLALTAPVYIQSILAIFALVFVFLITLIYQQMHKKGMYKTTPNP